MLGAEFIAHRLADIGIHIVRSDRAQAVRILILEKLLPRQVLQPAHESRKAAVADRHIAFCAALGDILQAQRLARRSEEHTSELQSLMRISYAVFCLKKTQKKNN